MSDFNAKLIPHYSRWLFRTGISTTNPGKSASTLEAVSTECFRLCCLLAQRHSIAETWCLDREFGQTNDRPVQIWACAEGNANQQWEVRYLEAAK